MAKKPPGGHPRLTNRHGRTLHMVLKFDEILFGNEYFRYGEYNISKVELSRATLFEYSKLEVPTWNW